MGDTYITGMEAAGGSTCICGQETRDEVKTCKRCLRGQHRSCLLQAFYMPNYECPQCQLEQLEPYQRVLQTLIPASLVQTQGSGVGPRYFTYSQEVHQMVYAKERKRTVQIRSIRLDRSGFEQIWAKACQVIVNGAVIYTTSSDLGAQHSRAMLVLSDLQPDSSVSVQVLRQRLDDSYAFAVFLVATLSPAEALAALVQENRVMTIEQGREFVQAVGVSTDLDSLNTRLSLRCPLTQTLPRLPARGTECKHVKCFDLEAFVVLQESTRTNRWRCPVCGLVVLRPVLDKYYAAIVHKAKSSQRLRRVEFLSDGDYHLLGDSSPLPPVSKRHRSAYTPPSKRSKATDSNSRYLYGY